jgi:putative hydrolase of the HAD superfamily
VRHLGQQSARCAVGFDIDHTLCIDNKLERVAFLNLLGPIAADGGTVGSVEAETLDIDRLLTRSRNGECGIDEAVERFADTHGARTPGSYAALYRRIALDLVDTFIVPDPAASATLAHLREEGVAVGLLSNGWNPLQAAKARRCGFVGQVLVSSDLGVRKPQREAFAALTDALGVDAGRCYYVGDDPYADVEGAARAGLLAVWLNSADRAYPADLPSPPLVITRLQDIVALALAEVTG